MEYPFESVLVLVSQRRDELIPLALWEWFGQHPRGPSAATQKAHERLSRRVDEMGTDEELKSWLHRQGSMQVWREMAGAMQNLFSFLAQAEAGNPAARRLVAELVGCPTLLNVARLALRGPVD